LYPHTHTHTHTHTHIIHTLIKTEDALIEGLNPVATPFPTASYGVVCVSAGEIHALVSADHAHRRHRYHVTLDDVIAALRQLVLVRECDTFGYLSVDNQLIVLVSAVTETPTKLQVI